MFLIFWCTWQRLQLLGILCILKTFEDVHVPAAQHLEET